MVEIYTDGGCRNNPGLGAWAFIVVENGKITHAPSCTNAHTTNNEMELTAICQAIYYAKMFGMIDTTIYTDSQYAVSAINIWYHQWSQQNNLAGKKNIPLIREILQNLNGTQIKIEWVKGHASNPFNTLADQLVNQAMDKASTASQ